MTDTKELLMKVRERAKNLLNRPFDRELELLLTSILSIGQSLQIAKDELLLATKENDALRSAIDDAYERGKKDEEIGEHGTEIRHDA